MTEQEDKINLESNSKSYKELVRIILMLIFIFSGISIFVYQIYIWLKYGYWQAISLLEPLLHISSTSDWAMYPDTWIGVNTILEKTPLSLFLIIFGFVIPAIINSFEE